MTCEPADLIDRATLTEAVKLAYERGKAEGEAAVLKGLKSVAGLNGSGGRVMDLLRSVADVVEKSGEWDESKHPRDHGQFSSKPGGSAKPLASPPLRVLGKDGKVIHATEITSARWEYEHGNKQPLDDLRARVHPDSSVRMMEIFHSGPEGDQRAHNARADVAAWRRLSGWVMGNKLVEYLSPYLDRVEMHGPLDSTTQRDLTVHVHSLTRAARIPELRSILRSIGVKHADFPPTKEGMQELIRETVREAFRKTELRYHDSMANEGDEYMGRPDVPKIGKAHDEEPAVDDAAIPDGEPASDDMDHDAEFPHLPAGLRYYDVMDAVELILHRLDTALARGDEETASVEKAKLATVLAPESVTKAKDAAGHEHRGKGPGGGQFTATPGGGSKTEPKPTKKKPAVGKKTPEKSLATDDSPQERMSKQAKSVVGTIRPAAKGQRAYTGEAAGTKIDSRLAGAIGEEIIIQHLHSLGFTDAKQTSDFLGETRNNLPMDLIEDHRLIEAKTGQSDNPNGVWALKYDGRFTAEQQAKLDKLEKTNPAKRAKLVSRINAAKVAGIHARKKAFIERLNRELGYEIAAGMMTVIINHDTKTADIYQFDGIHDRIPFKSEMAQAGYVRTVRYG